MKPFLMRVAKRWAAVAALLLVALLAFGFGMLARKSGLFSQPWAVGRLDPERLAVLRKAYPVAVEKESMANTRNPFGSHMVRMADAYIVAEVVEAKPDFIHPDPTAADMEVTASIARAPGAVVFFQSMVPFSFKSVVYRLRIVELLCRRDGVEETPLSAGRDIVASTGIGRCDSFPVFTPGARIVVGLSGSPSDMGVESYTFPLSGAFYVVDKGYVLPVVEEYEPSLCAGLGLETFRQRLLAEQDTTLHISSLRFPAEEALVASMDGGGGLYPRDILVKLAGLAERFGWRDAGWFRLANLPDGIRATVIILTSLPDRVTQQIDVDHMGERYALLQWNLDETDTDAQLAAWIQQGSLVESERPGIFINLDPNPDTPFGQARSTAWIQHGHCFRLVFVTDIIRENALDLCDVEQATLG